jgi:multimeric flavodoxin WrbA
MNFLVVSDSSDKSKLGTKVKQELKEFLQGDGHRVASYDIQKEDMHYCVGCFGCWLKTPGECVFKDISSDINKTYIGSDIAIFLSPVKYGCYTPAIRRALDRFLPNILPFFKKINGEMHHVPRYKKYPRFVTIGYGEDITAEEADTFRCLSDANALNFQVGKAQTYISKSETELSQLLDSFGKYIKECEIK